MSEQEQWLRESEKSSDLSSFFIWPAGATVSRKRGYQERTGRGECSSFCTENITATNTNGNKYMELQTESKGQIGVAIGMNGMRMNDSLEMKIDGEKTQIPKHTGFV